MKLLNHIDDNNMPPRNLIFVFVASVLQLSGCAQQTVLMNTDYDPVHSARIRVIGAGEMVYLYPGKDCYPYLLAGFGAANGIQASGGMANNLKLAFGGGIDNSSIGMPVGPNAKKSPDGSMWTKGYFREYVIPANQSMTIRMVLGGGGVYHYGAFKFIPNAGSDYETYIDCEGGKRCYGRLNVLDKDGDPVDQVRTIPAQQCPIEKESGFE